MGIWGDRQSRRPSPLGTMEDSSYPTPFPVVGTGLPREDRGKGIAPDHLGRTGEVLSVRRSAAAAESCQISSDFGAGRDTKCTGTRESVPVLIPRKCKPEARVGRKTEVYR
uniref:Uncharacterized protein n=1 Tax=Ananas comosus var. bracteatus TaxID=296719 RepID=A0A6V7QLR4_ANACO|nr:unnamed protein product [Ananas comosus var. bracteatus]